jgi:hypothetical protein
MFKSNQSHKNTNNKTNLLDNKKLSSNYSGSILSFDSKACFEIQKRKKIMTEKINNMHSYKGEVVKVDFLVEM